MSNQTQPKKLTPKEAAGRFAARAKRDGYHPEALHVYTHTDSDEAIYWRIRAKNQATGTKWIRPMHLTAEGYTLGEPSFPDGKPLYRLHDLAKSPDATVVITEGEWAADHLTRAGVLATTSGAADSARVARWSHIDGRDVLIWPDNDEAGVRYGQEVAGILAERGCRVRVIDVAALGLPPKGDAVDWLAAHPDVTVGDVLALPTLAQVQEQAQGAADPLPRDDATGANEGDPDDWGTAIDRLAALHPIKYEQEREATARALGVRASVLDKLVARVRKGIEDGGGVAQMFPTVDPWPDPVDGAELLSDVLATVRRFIVCEPDTAKAAALWCAFTWFIDWAQVAPIAVITAPEKRCGKSQLLDLIRRLSRRPLVASNISPAATFRTIEAHAPTLLIDEADTFLRDNEEMRGVLNSGHTRPSAYVIRTVGDDHEPRQFSTWGAKAISGIGKMPETLMDRAIVLELRRKLPSETVVRLRHAEPGLFEDLAAKLCRFADDHGEAVQRARPALPESLNDRAQDNWEPLLAIADCAGGEWPQVARSTAQRLSGSAQEVVSSSAELLADIQEVFETKRVDRLKTADLLAALIEDEEKPWATYNRGKPMTAKQLAKRIGEYGIASQTHRFGGWDTKKGYRVDQFDDAFARYLSSPLTPLSPVTPSQPSTGAGFDVTAEKSAPVTNQFSRHTSQIDGREGRASLAAADGGADPWLAEFEATENVTCDGSVKDVTATKNAPVTRKPAPVLGCDGVTGETPPTAKRANTITVVL